MGKKLLVTLDGSDHSKYSLSWTLGNIFDPNKDSLLLLSLGVLTDINPYEYSAATRNILNGDSEAKLKREQVEEQAKIIINDGKNLIKDFFVKKGHKEINLSIECILDSDSDPAKYIANFTKNQKIDVLVMGHRGISSPDATNIGTVSKYCLHSAPCTVIITRKK